MRMRAYLAASAAAASLAAVGLGGSSAHAADNIAVNQWYTGYFTAPNTALIGGESAITGTHGPVLGGGFGNAITSPQAPWSITLTGAGTLTVTDVETSGDRFQLFDNGVAMTPTASPFTGVGQNAGQAGLANGLTSVPVPNGSFGVEDINAALGNADYSSGTFALHSGVNDITGEYLGGIGAGDLDFIVESASAVPEPATWAMLLFGIGSLGLLLRSRRREAFAA